VSRARGFRRESHAKTDPLSYAAAVRLCGVASAISRDVAEPANTREAAEAALAEIVCDEPTLRGSVWVESIEIDESDPN
jgi:hypothetical protein